MKVKYECAVEFIKYKYVYFVMFTYARWQRQCEQYSCAFLSLISERRKEKSAKKKEERNLLWIFNFAPNLFKHRILDCFLCGRFPDRIYMLPATYFAFKLSHTCQHFHEYMHK